MKTLEQAAKKFFKTTAFTIVSINRDDGYAFVKIDGSLAQMFTLAARGWEPCNPNFSNAI